MINVNGTNIEMTRGDTLILQVTIYQDDEPYVPQEGDAVRFAMKHAKLNGSKTQFVDVEPVATADIPTDTMLLRLESEQTKSLEFGDYIYDIQITFADGTVDTFIANAKLKLLPEVS